MLRNKLTSFVIMATFAIFLGTFQTSAQLMESRYPKIGQKEFIFRSDLNNYTDSFALGWSMSAELLRVSLVCGWEPDVIIAFSSNISEITKFIERTYNLESRDKINKRKEIWHKQYDKNANIEEFDEIMCLGMRAKSNDILAYHIKTISPILKVIREKSPNQAAMQFLDLNDGLVPPR